MAHDAAVIGGGIIGAAAAAFLAESGRSVVLLEREALAAGASGRNSGVLQQPLDPPLAELHRASLGLYRELAGQSTGDDREFVLGQAPAGLLLVSRAAEALELEARRLSEVAPELEPELVRPGQMEGLEPALASGVGGCRLATGYPVVPAAATLAFARRAERAGALVSVGIDARPWIEHDRLRGVALATGERMAAAQVLVAAGPWSAGLLPAWADAAPIGSTYGVVVSTRLREPPGHVLEELGIDPAGSVVPNSFSLVSAGGVSSVGSTFLLEPPQPADHVEHLLARGAGFVPQLAHAPRLGVRSCARPVSFDGRPLIGRYAGIAGLFVCAGHGPWGLSTGPASARLVVDAMLAPDGADDQIPPDLDARRWPPRPAGTPDGQPLT